MDVQFKVMYNDIGQVKDEIREKDHTLVREKFVTDCGVVTAPIDRL